MNKITLYFKKQSLYRLLTVSFINLIFCFLKRPFWNKFQIYDAANFVDITFNAIMLYGVIRTLDGATSAFQLKCNNNSIIVQ